MVAARKPHSELWFLAFDGATNSHFSSLLLRLPCLPFAPSLMRALPALRLSIVRVAAPTSLSFYGTFHPRISADFLLLSSPTSLSRSFRVVSFLHRSRLHVFSPHLRSLEPISRQLVQLTFSLSLSSTVPAFATLPLQPGLFCKPPLLALH